MSARRFLLCHYAIRNPILPALVTCPRCSSPTGLVIAPWGFGKVSDNTSAPGCGDESGEVNL